jgi:hypothetical protein
MARLSALPAVLSCCYRGAGLVCSRIQDGQGLARSLACVVQRRDRNGRRHHQEAQRRDRADSPALEPAGRPSFHESPRVHRGNGSVPVDRHPVDGHDGDRCGMRVSRACPRLQSAHQAALPASARPGPAFSLAACFLAPLRTALAAREAPFVELQESPTRESPLPWYSRVGARGPGGTCERRGGQGSPSPAGTSADEDTGDGLL